ncbi:hypothetical protein DERP_014104 [Dermatophagoides pteronyssinus]|uniref:Uncharacterized protein n=1 Tax=Dermatophagoides pteronyssinus TaxID=6956 RepID=A0ABQ8J6F9_DERPT|nr:hypothetical protein DERP_014104 [Dermatophagoides pteronyssinus]
MYFRIFQDKDFNTNHWHCIKFISLTLKPDSGERVKLFLKKVKSSLNSRDSFLNQLFCQIEMTD